MVSLRGFISTSLKCPESKRKTSFFVGLPPYGREKSSTWRCFSAQRHGKLPIVYRRIVQDAVRRWPKLFWMSATLLLPRLVWSLGCNEVRAEKATGQSRSGRLFVAASQVGRNSEAAATKDTHALGRRQGNNRQKRPGFASPTGRARSAK